MSLAMILAARPARLERLLGGLDQFYRLHRKLGIAGTLFALTQWLLEMLPRWMLGKGWLVRRRRGDGDAGLPVPFAEWRDPAREPGAWGLCLILALVVVALWKRIPYRFDPQWAGATRLAGKLLPSGILRDALKTAARFPAPEAGNPAGAGAQSSTPSLTKARRTMSRALMPVRCRSMLSGASR